ncbi:MAG: hypothetical protein ABR973_17220 [Candidatus Acidiferrales bacterium]|jgi:hypothetical protein
MSDRTDELIQALVTARESGLAWAEARDIARDVYAAPWSFGSRTRIVTRVSGSRRWSWS